MQYHQISSGERYAIAALRRQGLSARAIARNLCRAPSSICREVTRNVRADGGYRAFTACERTRAGRRRSRRNSHFGPAEWALIEELLARRWSPEQIAGRLRAEKGRSGSQAMSHRGRSGLRQVAYMATISCLAHNPRMRAHYDRLVSRPERPLAKMTALGACMNKLLLWAFAVMSKRRAFELDHEWKEYAA